MRIGAAPYPEGSAALASAACPIGVSSFNGEKSAQAQITFLTADGLTDATSLRLVPDGDEWRPCP
jgi:hypothetical protein